MVETRCNFLYTSTVLTVCNTGGLPGAGWQKKTVCYSLGSTHGAKPKRIIHPQRLSGPRRSRVAEKPLMSIEDSLSRIYVITELNKYYENHDLVEYLVLNDGRI